jgi:hypothetical protein
MRFVTPRAMTDELRDIMNQLLTSYEPSPFNLYQDRDPHHQQLDWKH